MGKYKYSDLLPDTSPLLPFARGRVFSDARPLPFGKGRVIYEHTKYSLELCHQKKENRF
jgi:hypothetical protein